MVIGCNNGIYSRNNGLPKWEDILLDIDNMLYYDFDQCCPCRLFTSRFVLSSHSSNLQSLYFVFASH